GEKRARWFVSKQKLRQQRCRPERKDSKASKCYRMPWPMQNWLQKLSRQIFPIRRQGLLQAPIRARIVVQLFRRNIDVSAETGGGIVVQRVRQRNFGLNPFKPEALQRERLEKWRGCCKWMNCRTDIMQKERQSELGRTRSTPNRRVCFTDNDGTSRARKRDRRREAIRSRADDNRIISICHEFQQQRFWESSLISCDSKATHALYHTQTCRTFRFNFDRANTASRN